jgi:hypothetical protein
MYRSRGTTSRTGPSGSPACLIPSPADYRFVFTPVERDALIIHADSSRLRTFPTGISSVRRNFLIVATRAPVKVLEVGTSVQAVKMVQDCRL